MPESVDHKEDQGKKAERKPSRYFELSAKEVAETYTLPGNTSFTDYRVTTAELKKPRMFQKSQRRLLLTQQVELESKENSSVVQNGGSRLQSRKGYPPVEEEKDSSLEQHRQLSIISVRPKP